MRRVFCSILMILLIFNITGCTKNKTYKILLCGFSDSVPEIAHEYEYTKWNGDAWVDETVQNTVNQMFGEFRVEGDYLSSDIQKYDYYQTNRYVDANQNFFEVSFDGMLTSYFWGSSDVQDNISPLTEAQCVDIAYDFLNCFVNASQYRVKTQYYPNQKYYEIIFDKYIGDIKSADQAQFIVEENGHICSYESTMLGRIPTDASIDFDIESISQEVRNKIEQIYQNVIPMYDKVEYGDLEYVLTMTDDSEYALVFTISISFINSVGDYDEVISEKLQLFVQ